MTVVCTVFLFSCSRSGGVARTPVQTADIEIVDEREMFIDDFWHWAYSDAGIPKHLADKAISSLTESPEFVMELLELFAADSYYYILVDKKNALPKDYSPTDLVDLKSGTYQVSRPGMTLRQPAVEALEAMAAAAKQEGVSFTIGSAFRTYEYQDELYKRYVRENGKEETDRFSAMPGHSQHQLGLVVDFFPVENVFDTMPASAWLKKNASHFGWSLSYPDGYEEVTGYMWESWHYRYVGAGLAAFIDKYFDGIQQYALQFIKAWKELKD